MIEAFSQLASVSAVLGGFALVFLGAIISLTERSLPMAVTAALSLLCSTTFVLCALGWTLSAVWLGSPLAPADGSMPEFMALHHASLSPLFLVGVCLFFWALGACGWVYSRLLGYFSTAVAVLATVGAYFVVVPFLLY